MAHARFFWPALPQGLGGLEKTGELGLETTATREELDMINHKWIAAMSFGCLLAIPLSTRLEAHAVAAEIPKNLTVDACEGGDLHLNFGVDISYATNFVSITKGGTYPNDPNNF